MISIITAIHNQLVHNKLYLDSIKRYSFYPHEIILIDNNSKDTSAEFFESQGCKVIRNNKNLCYPESMNIGINHATYDYICFLNNDVYVGAGWDRYLIEGMNMYGLDAVSPIGNEKMPTADLTRRSCRRWKRVGRSKHPQMDETGLYSLLNKMYGDWEGFCREIHNKYYSQVFDGITGCCVMLKKDLIEKVGLWDERVQAGDWDFYLKVRRRELEYRDVKRVMTVCWSYVHHFVRATVKNNPEPFACVHPTLSIEEKWGMEAVRRLWSDPEEVRPKAKERLCNYLKKKLLGIKGYAG